MSGLGKSLRKFYSGGKAIANLHRNENLSSQRKENEMQEIRNKDGKKIAMVDALQKSFEIRFKGSMTTVVFNPDGTITVMKK